MLTFPLFVRGALGGTLLSMLACSPTVWDSPSGAGDASTGRGDNDASSSTNIASVDEAKRDSGGNAESSFADGRVTDAGSGRDAGSISDAAPDKLRDCEPSAKRCTKQHAIETCSSDGAWGVAVPCPFSCTGAAQCSGECSPGDKRCDPAQALTPQTCDEGGNWVSGQACANLCSNGSCSGSCTPGVSRCGANQVSEHCDAQGTWQLTNACPHVCTGAGLCTGECKPGDKDCGSAALLPGQAATPRACDDSGRWQPQAACSGQSCSAGTCVGECVAGGTQCSALAVAQICAESGHWVNGGAMACSASNLALGASVTASSTIEIPPTVGLSLLVDGRTDTMYSSAQRNTAQGFDDGSHCADWVAVEMSGNVTFSTVVLVPRTGPDAVGLGFPISFTIDLWDGEKWITRLPVPPNDSLPSTPQSYQWGHADTTTRVRICAKLLREDPAHHFFLQFEELQLLP